MTYTQSSTTMKRRTWSAIQAAAQGKNAGPIDGRDPAVALAAVVEMRRRLAVLEHVHVQRMRDAGATWADVASVLNVTPQGAHKAHAYRRQASIDDL